MSERLKFRALSHMAGEVLGDMGNLAREAADLLGEFSQSTRAMGRIRVLLAAGAATVLLGAILLCEMLVQLFAVLMPEQPAWMAYGAVGIPVLGIGVALMAVGRQRMKALNPLREQSDKVMRDATQTVEHAGETADAMRESFHESVESVRHALDLEEQFNKRPWTLIAGAVSLGFLGGAVLHGDGAPAAGPTATTQEKPRRRAADHRGSLARLAGQFEPELAQIKGMVLGALFGIVRDLASKSAPQKMHDELEDVINGITVKAGGTPVQGPVLREPVSGNGTSRIKQ